MDPAHLAFLHVLPGSEGFTDDFKELGEWDWMETPLGMVYIDTRRQDDRVWVRLADLSSPTSTSSAQCRPDGLRNSIARPQATTWAVPLDDTHTMQIAITGRRGKEMRRGAGFGQDASRPYEERQRVPGDYDAQSASTAASRGTARAPRHHRSRIIMMRNMIRRGIRAVGKGEELGSPMLRNAPGPNLQPRPGGRRHRPARRRRRTSAVARGCARVVRETLKTGLAIT